MDLALSHPPPLSRTERVLLARVAKRPVRHVGAFHPRTPAPRLKNRGLVDAHRIVERKSIRTWALIVTSKGVDALG